MCNCNETRDRRKMYGNRGTNPTVFFSTRFSVIGVVWMQNSYSLVVGFYGTAILSSDKSLAVGNLSTAPPSNKPCTSRIYYTRTEGGQSHGTNFPLGIDFSFRKSPRETKSSSNCDNFYPHTFVRVVSGHNVFGKQIAHLVFDVIIASFLFPFNGGFRKQAKPPESCRNGR